MTVAQPIHLTDDQIAALAEAAGLDGSEVAAAIYQANANRAADTPALTPAPAQPAPRLSVDDIKRMAREGRHADIEQARIEDRIDFESARR